MAVDLFAGVAVSDYPAALLWYEKLFGAPPAFFPNEIEAVWEIAEHRFVFIEHKPEHAGHARHLIFLEDLDAAVTRAAAHGLEPADVEAYEGGVQKIAYRDADGNEIGFGGVPGAKAGHLT